MASTPTGERLVSGSRHPIMLHTPVRPDSDLTTGTHGAEFVSH